jgi:hypothetical protein
MKPEVQREQVESSDIRVRELICRAKGAFSEITYNAAKQEKHTMEYRARDVYWMQENDSGYVLVYRFDTGRERCRDGIGDCSRSSFAADIDFRHD